MQNRFLPLLLLCLTLSAGCDVVRTNDDAHRITGFIRSETACVDGIRVVLTGGANAEVFTSEDGHFSFEDLPPNELYVVTPESVEHEFEPETLVIENLTADRTVNFEARPAEAVNATNRTALFAPATAEEVQQIRADWNGRRIVSTEYRVEGEQRVASGLLRIISHVVDGNRHYAAVHCPPEVNGASLPLVILNHGGDDGVNLDGYLLSDTDLQSITQRAIIALPSFRSEPLVTSLGTFYSEGDPSPWDRDVDDALAMMESLIRHEPRVDPGRIAVIGISRGAGVGLLMGIRDDRISAVVSFYGPTDFFDDYVREATRMILESEEVIDLPGAASLAETILIPLRDKRLSLEAARLELVRRSPVLFAEHLPAVQVHHGAYDFVVRVSQAHRLRTALLRAGREHGSPNFDFHLYPEGGHSIESLPESMPRAAAFLVHHLDLNHGSNTLVATR